MNSEQSALWQRIQSHVLDDPQSAAPFSLRLAKENRWGPAFTQRAIEEYRRFAFLAAAAGHPVAPSAAVDQVWHQHLLYTRDYWEVFCARVLGRSLHHGPSRGGARETDKLGAWYAQTLTSYRGFFGEPAADIWPENPNHPALVKVDVAKYWILPKPALPWTRRRRQPADRNLALPSTAGPTLVALAAFCAAASELPAATARFGWPLELLGPDYLAFFVGFSVLVLGVAAGLRWWLRVPWDPPRQENLETYLVAQLVGGPKRAFVAAVVNATQRRLIRVQKGMVYRLDAALPGELPLLERTICDSARADGTKVDVVQKAVEDVLVLNRRDLEERGLFVHGDDAVRARLVPLGVAALAPLFGCAKIAIGLSRDRPVAALVFLTFFVTVAAAMFLSRPHRSRRGDALVRMLRSEHADAKRINVDHLAHPQATSVLPFAIGLWGLTAIQGTSMDREMRELGRIDASSGGGGACGSSCGNGGCGGGGGCGGCGGGGD